MSTPELYSIGSTRFDELEDQVLDDGECADLEVAELLDLLEEELAELCSASDPKQRIERAVRMAAMCRLIAEASGVER